MASFTAPANAIELYAGESRTLHLCVVDQEGTKVDITGGRIVFTVKCDVSDPRPRLTKDTAVGPAQAAIISPLDGLAEIYISPSDTLGWEEAEYIYDVWLVLAGKQHAIIPRSTFSVLRPLTLL